MSNGSAQKGPNCIHLANMLSFLCQDVRMLIAKEHPHILATRLLSSYPLINATFSSTSII